MNHNDMKRNNGMRDTISATRKRHGSGGFAIRQLRMLLTQGNCPLVRADEITAHSPRHYGSLPTTLRLVITRSGGFAIRLLLIMVMLTGGVSEALPITITTDTSNPVYYLIQSYANTGFYMRPNGSNVSTLNILTDDMKWYFLNAGKENEGTENEIQYYYICDKDGRYMYFSSPNYVGTGSSQRIWMALHNTRSGSDDNYKFSIADYSGGGSNIIPKGTTNNSSLNKQGGNAGTGNVQVGSGVADEGSRWNIISLANYEWALRGDCFRPSNISNKYFYRIKSQKDVNYYIKPGPTYVETSNTVDDDMIWYFEEATSDELMAYYYIRLANTGQYLRFLSNEVAQDNAIELANHTGSETGDAEARFQFIVVRGANEKESVADPKGIIFNIVPKLLKSSSNDNNIKSISSDKGLGQPLKTKNHRYENTTHWSFVSVEYSTVCTNPTITFSNITGKATISTATSRSTIYYTTDGTEPSSSNGTEYSAPFDVTEETTIKAIVTRTGFTDSEVTNKTIYKVTTPTIQNNGSNAISITTETEGATIYYTTNGNTPTTSSTEYTGPLTENVSGVTINAIAVKEGMINSSVGTGSVTLQCARPIISIVGGYATISCSFPSSGVSIYYTKNGDTPTSSSTPYSSSFSVVIGDVVKAIAIATGYNDSEVSVKTIREELTPTDGIYYINNDDDFETFVDMANSGGASYHYVLRTNVNAGSAIIEPFTGTFDGGLYTISGLNHPLFNTVNGGVVKNVILDNVNISSSDENVGAIAGIAKGYSRIYNCGILPKSADFPNGTHPSVTTSGACAGGLVGRLEDDSRVINCYSYADVSATTTAAGIVGYNAYISGTTDGIDYGSTTKVENIEGVDKYTELRTAVVNCMFYGNITGGTNQYGVYGGALITNATATGISSYNYYRNGSTFSTSSGEPTAYNCSFPADERYLTQVEFHRSLLNSNRELCGWWVSSDIAPSTMSTTDVQAIPKDASLMYKWVVDPNLAPYPILKPFGKYASIINGSGNQLSTLTVTVQSGDHSSAANQILTLPITDMDTQNHDYSYYKVQLPYFNTVFGNPNGATWAEKYAGNYTDYVVTGWKVTTVNKNGKNSFVADWQNGYNFADRDCTDKDLYSTSGRVFAQGGYYYVPNGVTAITIEAYWGKAIYVRNNESSYDRVNITEGNTGSHFAPAGTRSNNVNGATIYTTKIRDVIDNITEKNTVYDHAIVLVGNVQESNSNNAVTVTAGNTYGFTIMSADFDFDEEPDYCLEWQLGTKTTRNTIAPIRFDFLPVVELGIAGKLHNSDNFFSLGCFRSYGHFEVTETAFIRFGQFEFELGSRDDGPIILNGGIFDQYTRGRNGETNQHITYVIVGGHLVMPSFTPGAHVGENYQTRHCAVNALGGNFNSFYLTGGYREDVDPFDDNPHCYIDGGHFGTIAAACKEGIKGNVTWRINHALIDEFYGGGIMSNDNMIVKGNIDVVINNSIVGKYCGGPKFGDMVSGKTVTTSATGTTFNQFFGAGNGGTNYVQFANDDKTDGPRNASQWLTLLTSGGNGKYSPKKYISTEKGYHANYDYEEINPSTGTTTSGSIDRIYYYSAQFATTNTGNVTSTLTNCTVEQNFYGAGFLGGVNGNVTSTLTDTRVLGSVFGAGYSASAGTVTIYNTDKTPPSANVYTGMIKPQSGGTSTTYNWTHETSVGGNTLSTSNPAATNVGGKNYFYTEVPLDNLGAVNGNVTLTLNGTTEEGTTVGGDVYGGGDASAVTGATHTVTVNLQGKTTVSGDVFGGGNMGLVEGSAKVKIMVPEE